LGLIKMTSSYQSQLAILLARLSEQTYVQYRNGPPPGNDGMIDAGPGYTQVASFRAPEIELSQARRLTDLHWDEVSRSADVRSRFVSIGDVYFGFALTSSSHNIIALRGTQSDFEWLLDTAMPQAPVPLAWYRSPGFERARVHLGFLILLSMLEDQIVTAAGKFDHSLPCLVAGHSLGGALSVLACPLLKLLAEISTVQMYSFGAPRVGNPAFAQSYNETVSESFRVVNLADLAPLFPPTKALGGDYLHVGEEWSFLNQSGDVGGNHALIAPNNYTDAVVKMIPTDASRAYPVTGLGDPSGRIS
jgi:triacylglycerol lipase